MTTKRILTAHGLSFPTRRLRALVLACVGVPALVVGSTGCSSHDDPGTVTVTSVIDTTVTDGVDAPHDVDALTDNDVPDGPAPDFSQLSMNPNKDPQQRAFLKEVQRQGLKTTNMDNAVVGMGYMVCFSKGSPQEAQQMQHAMAVTLAGINPGTDPGKAERIVVAAARKHLCT